MSRSNKSLDNELQKQGQGKQQPTMEMEEASPPVVSKKHKSVQGSSLKKERKRGKGKHQEKDEDAPPVPPQKKKKLPTKEKKPADIFDHEENKKSVCKENSSDQMKKRPNEAAAAETSRSKMKKPGCLFNHEDNIKILEAAQIWSEKGTLTDKDRFYAHIERRLSIPQITKDQAYEKMCKLKKRYKKWVKKGEHQFDDPLKQELHDVCEKIWAIEVNLSGVAMEVVSEELRRRPFWKLGWSYQKPQ